MIGTKLRKSSHFLIIGVLCSCFFIGIMPVNLNTSNPSYSSHAMFEETRSAQLPADVFNKITCTDLLYWITEPGEGSAGLLDLYVEDVISQDNELGEGIGTEMNDTSLDTYDYEVVDLNRGNEIVKSGEFEYVNESGSVYWYKNTTTVGIPEGNNYAVRTNFDVEPEVANATTYSGPFSISHVVTLQLSLNYLTETTARLTVLDAFSSFSGNQITDADLEESNSATYKIKNNETDDIIDSGTLDYDDGWFKSISTDEPLTSNIYAVVEFELTGIIDPVSTVDEWSDDSKIIGAPISEGGNENDNKNLVYALIGSIGGVLFLGSIFLYTKKQKSKIEGKDKNEEEIIEIVDISKASLKKTKLEPTKKKTKKMKDINEGGLIFDVPTWEIEDEDEDKPDVDTTSTASISSLTLHCPKCNSWYEVDEFEKIKCPKCKQVLEVAMWCNSCQKWFDVPEPMNVDCPLCNNKLSLSK